MTLKLRSTGRCWGVREEFSFALVFHWEHLKKKKKIWHKHILNETPTVYITIVLAHDFGDFCVCVFPPGSHKKRTETSLVWNGGLCTKSKPVYATITYAGRYFTRVCRDKVAGELWQRIHGRTGRVTSKGLTAAHQCRAPHASRAGFIVIYWIVANFYGLRLNYRFKFWLWSCKRTIRVKILCPVLCLCIFKSRCNKDNQTVVMQENVLVHRKYIRKYLCKE